MIAAEDEDGDAIDGGDDAPAKGRQRLDKWLWYARVVKTRTLAAKLVAAGKVRVNRQRVAKPGATIKSGDVLTIAVHERVRVLEMREPGVRRGPPAEAQALFVDLSPESAAPPPRDPAAPVHRRPSKRERRQVERLRDERE